MPDINDYLKFMIADRFSTPISNAIGKRLDPSSDLTEESLRLDIMDKKRRLGLSYEDDEDYERALNDDSRDKTVDTLYRKYSTDIMRSIPEPSFLTSHNPNGSVFWKTATHVPESGFLTKLMGSAKDGKLLSAIGKRFARIG